MVKNNKKTNQDKTPDLERIRELLYYKHYNDVEFGVEQAYGYAASAGWNTPEIEEANTLAVDVKGDPLGKYTK